MTGRLAGLLLVVALVAGCREEAQIATPPPPEVSIAQPIERTVTDALDYTGRMAAVEEVEIRARVSGYIIRVDFVAGALVKQGDLLFEIDPREYQSAVKRSEGEIARLQAVLARAVSEVGRTQRLRPSGAASQREVETAIASKGAAEGELKSAIAQLEKAKLDLQFTRVVAPIAGRVSRAELTAGNLVAVTPSGGPVLTTIVSIDPIWIYFDIDERSMLRVREAALRRTGRIAAPENVVSLNIPVQFGLANETGHPHTAQLDFVDNHVDQATGTMRVRAVVPNADRIFSPGFFVRVSFRSASRIRRCWSRSAPSARIRIASTCSS